MKYPAKAIVFSATLLAVFTTIALWFMSRQKINVERTAERDRELSIASLLVPEPQRGINDASFTKSGYIVPLENNATGSVYSLRAQVRGTVKHWSSETLAVTISAQETKNLKFSPFVRLYCTPKYFTDNQGNQVLASTVWVSVPSPETEGTLIPTTDIAKQFPVGSDVLVYVNVDSQDAMTANLVVGYGCQVKK